MLSKRIIQVIDESIQQQGLEYADLRTEILDHIACMVEEKKIKYPFLPEKTVIYSVLWDFNIAQYVNNLEQRKNEGTKSWFNAIGKSLLQELYSKSLKVYLTFSLVFFLILIMKWIKVDWTYYLLLFHGVIISGYFSFIFYRNKEKIKRSFKRTTFYRAVSNLVIIWVYPFVIGVINYNDYKTIMELMGSAAFFLSELLLTLFILTILIFSKVLIKKSNILLKEESYSHA